VQQGIPDVAIGAFRSGKAPRWEDLTVEDKNIRAVCLAAWERQNHLPLRVHVPYLSPGDYVPLKRWGLYEYRDLSSEDRLIPAVVFINFTYGRVTWEDLSPAEKEVLTRNWLEQLTLGRDKRSLQALRARFRGTSLKSLEQRLYDYLLPEEIKKLLLLLWRLEQGFSWPWVLENL
jgi:hypothetical protein